MTTINWMDTSRPPDAMNNDTVLQVLPAAVPEAAGDAMETDRGTPRRQPDAVILSDFTRCPVCWGEGCRDCNDRGHVPPGRAEHLEDLLERIQVSDIFLESLDEILADPGVPEPTRRRQEWAEAQAVAASRLLAQWANTLPGMAELIERTGLRRIRPAESA